MLLVQTQGARWKAAALEQLTGAHLYLDIAKSGYPFHGSTGGMSETTCLWAWNCMMMVLTNNVWPCGHYGQLFKPSPSLLLHYDAASES